VNGWHHTYTHTTQGAPRAVICATLARPEHPGDITARWVGASTPTASDWIQAGILRKGDRMRVYVEQSRPYVLRQLGAPVPGHCYRFAIVSNGDWYTVTIDGWRVPGAAARVPSAVYVATDERLSR